MPESFHVGVDTLLGLSVVIIGWLLRNTASKYDQAINDLKSSLTSSTSLIKSDEEILSVVNGKYISRREVDMLVKERDEWRMNLMMRLSSANEIDARLREFLDKKYMDDRTTVMVDLGVLKERMSRVERER